eukprot:TRINITY_DN19260_c0_g1_i1.p1 TRINITY_DN19260_c0_g1~~TRINITY_DN19260_c0_g1_i1.p1  ORF type:complete len:270 (+),score=70.45 TRINITY_DN19260_c0_g1_i1:57-812(+)
MPVDEAAALRYMLQQKDNEAEVLRGLLRQADDELRLRSASEAAPDAVSTLRQLRASAELLRSTAGGEDAARAVLADGEQLAAHAAAQEAELADVEESLRLLRLSSTPPRAGTPALGSPAPDFDGSPPSARGCARPNRVADADPGARSDAPSRHRCGIATPSLPASMPPSATSSQASTPPLHCRPRNQQSAWAVGGRRLVYSDSECKPQLFRAGCRPPRAVSVPSSPQPRPPQAPRDDLCLASVDRPLVFSF